MFVTKAMKIKQIKSHPGNVIVMGHEKDMYIVNVHKMMIYKHFQYDIEGCCKCTFKNKAFIISGKSSLISINLNIDKKGKIHVWKDESEPSPVKNATNSILVEITN
jgi:hypothetical protein